MVNQLSSNLKNVIYIDIKKVHEEYKKPSPLDVNFQVWFVLSDQ